MFEKINDDTLYYWGELHPQIAEKYPESLLVYSYTDEEHFKVVARKSVVGELSADQRNEIFSAMMEYARPLSPVNTIQIVSTEWSDGFGYLC